MGGGYGVVVTFYKLEVGLRVPGHAPEPQETLLDHCPKCLYLNAFMFKARIWIPFEFGVTILLHHIVPMVLLNHKLLQGYVTFAGKGNTKLIDNLPDSVPEWKSKFFYAWLVTREHNWGIPNWWVEKLPEPIFASAKELEALPRLNSSCPDTSAMLASSLSATKKKRKRLAQKRPRLSVEEELAREEEADP
ncbi:hypothetical protein ACLOJK_019295 [Asimina triloba]